MPINVKWITPEEIQPFPSDNQGLNADEVTQVINRFWDQWLKEDYITTLQNQTHFIINWNQNFFAWSGDSNTYPPRAIL